MAGSVAQIVGINYNNTTLHNQYLCIDRSSGNVTVLNTFDFDSGYYFGNSFTTDVAAGRAYAVSSVGTLYAFDLATGIIQQSVPLDINVIDRGLSGQLVGIKTPSTGPYEFYSIDPTTGNSTLLSNFTLTSSGFVADNFVTDLAAGVAGAQGTAYLLSGDQKLYTFNMTTGALLGTPQLSSGVALIDVGLNGSLIGIYYPSGGVWGLRSIDPATGNETLLSSFSLASGINQSTFKADPATNTLYVVSGFPYQLYTFNLSTGALLPSPSLSMSVQIIGIGTTLCPLPPGPNLYMKDRPQDLGTEPNPSTLPMWESEDIWLRKTQDSAHTFAHITENAEYRTGTANPNYVYVDVRNRGGAASAGTEQLTLYWAKASSGLSWPDPWNGGLYFDPGPNTMLMGGVLGTVTLPVIAAGAEYIMEFPWNPPDPSVYTGALAADQNHFCLLTRITTSATAPFGMTFPEQVGDLYGNVQNNNHIAWKNIHIYDLLPGAGAPAHAMIANLGKHKVNVKLEFRAVDAEGNHVLLDRGTLKVTLGEKLNAISKQNRLSGEGSKKIADDTFLIVKDAGYLQNIPLEPNEYATLDVSFVPNNAREKSKGHAITITQLVQAIGTERIIGGQTFVFGTVKGFGTSGGGSDAIGSRPWWRWPFLGTIILFILVVLWLRKK